MDFITDLDYSLFRLINDFAGSNYYIDKLMKAMVNDHFVPMTLGLALVVLIFLGNTKPERRRSLYCIIETLAAVAVVSAAVHVINIFIFRDRPFVDHQVNLLFYMPVDSSFPSNPAAVCFAFFFAIFRRNRLLAWCILPLCAMMPIARVYTGVHYPLDVLSGVAIAWLSVFIVVKLRFLGEPLKYLADWLEDRIRGNPIPG